MQYSSLNHLHSQSTNTFTPHPNPLPSRGEGTFALNHSISQPLNPIMPVIAARSPVNAAKNFFFDRQSITAGMDKAERFAMMRFGARVRADGRQNIRKRRPRALQLKRDAAGRFASGDKTSASRPGQGPTNQTGLLKRFIFFQYDPVAQNVVIGPIKLYDRAGENVPDILEHGGMATLIDPEKKTRKRYMMAPRPFMQPAFERQKLKLKDYWQDAMHRAGA